MYVRWHEHRKDTNSNQNAKGKRKKKAVKINSTALVPRKEECKQMIYQSLTAASSLPALCIALSILFF